MNRVSVWQRPSPNADTRNALAGSYKDQEVKVYPPLSARISACFPNLLYEQDGVMEVVLVGLRSYLAHFLGTNSPDSESPPLLGQPWCA